MSAVNVIRPALLSAVIFLRPETVVVISASLNVPVVAVVEGSNVVCPRITDTSHLYVSPDAGLLSPSTEIPMKGMDNSIE